MTTGASNDIQVATAMARNMVTRYGMSDKLGPVAFDSSDRLSMTRGEWVEKSGSEATAALVDAEVSRIMNEALNKARTILTDKRSTLNNMSEELIKVETLERDEFDKLLTLNGIKPKREEKEKAVSL